MAFHDWHIISKYINNSLWTHMVAPMTSVHNEEDRTLK